MTLKENNTNFLFYCKWIIVFAVYLIRFSAIFIVETQFVFQMREFAGVDSYWKPFIWAAQQHRKPPEAHKFKCRQKQTNAPSSGDRYAC